MTDHAASTLSQAVDADELRRTIARIPAPVTIVTTVIDGIPVGFTASSFVNVSVSPPLVGVFVAETARSHAAFSVADHVAINVMADHQSDIATVFAGRSDDKFAGVELDGEIAHVPVVAGAMAAIVGRVAQRIVLGDHLMLVLQVEHAVRRVAAPLVYQDRAFRVLVDLF